MSQFGYIYDEKIVGDFKSFYEAAAHASNWLSEKCDEDDEFPRRMEMEFVRFDYNKDDERSIFLREFYTIHRNGEIS